MKKMVQNFLQVILYLKKFFSPKELVEILKNFLHLTGFHTVNFSRTVRPAPETETES